MQSLPLDIKVRMTKARIISWYQYWEGDIYISFSGGKDSTVLKHITESIYGDQIPSVFVNTGLEYPEIRQFALKQKNVIRIDPQLKFYDIVNTYGYPVFSKEVAKTVWEAKRSLEINPDADTAQLQKLHGTKRNPDGSLSAFNIPQYGYLLDAPFKISDRCCHFLKKEPCYRYEKETGNKAMIATMACESMLRRTRWLNHGCNAFKDKRPVSTPMSFWTEQDVLKYIVQNKLEIAPVYGEIVEENGKYRTTNLDRTGCMFCLFGIHREPQPNRFLRMKKTHPRQYEYCMNNLGIDKVLTWLKIEH